MAKDVPTKLWKGESFRYAHLKRDGMWISLVQSPSGPTAWSRKPASYTDKLQWHPTLKKFGELAKKFTTLYCEAFVEGGVREDVKAAIRDEDPALRIEAFAIGNLDPLSERELAYMPLEQAETVCLGVGVPFVPYVPSWMKRVYPSKLTDLPPDSEGWMLKDGNLLNWMKAKPVETLDLVVVGFTEAREGKTGKYLGQVGAVILADATGREITQVSGMDDDVRLDITSRREQYLGKIVEIEIQGRGSAGGLMHPRWVRVRDDKSTADTVR